MTRHRLCVLSSAAFSLLLSTSVLAQPAAPAAPARGTTLTASAGLALTSGNKDTSTVNLGYELVYDPKTKNLVKSDGLYLHGKSEGELTADRLGLNGRDEYTMFPRTYAFGQVQYLRDQFKNIDYLFAPSGGLGYRLLDTPAAKLSVDGGLGGVWEKAPGFDVQSSGAVTLNEKLTYQLSPSATVSQSIGALYKTRDFSDSLYAFGGAIAATITPRTQLKVEVLDTYKNLVLPAFVKNDVAVIVSMVFKR